MSDKPQIEKLSQPEKPPTGGEALSLAAPRASGEGEAAAAGKVAGEAAGGGIAVTAALGEGEKKGEEEEGENGEW